MTARRFGAVTAGAVSMVAVLIVSLAGCTNARQHASGTAGAQAGVPSASATAQPAADGVQQVVIDTTNDDRFKPDVVYAHPGKVRITITNTSVLPHDFAIPTLGVSSSTVFAGDSATVTVDVTQAGVYPFVCTFHQHQGMDGELIVS